MQCFEMVKFVFRVRTRDGLIVDRVRIGAGSVEEAERKLRQMYRQCVILARDGEAEERSAESIRDEGLSFEALASTLARA